MRPTRLLLLVPIVTLAACGTTEGPAPDAGAQAAATETEEGTGVSPAEADEALAALDDLTGDSDAAANPIPASTADSPPKAQPAALMQETVQGEYNRLDAEETRVILNKGTEWRGTGKLYKNKAKGTYICRQCNAALYTSEQKFESGCGWPSFDDEIEGAVTRRDETDGTGRTEIVCTNCDGHLGHVFLGERFTEKNTRHCVNSVSMSFVPAGEPLPAKIVN